MECDKLKKWARWDRWDSWDKWDAGRARDYMGALDADSFNQAHYQITTTPITGLDFIALGFC